MFNPKKYLSSNTELNAQQNTQSIDVNNLLDCLSELSNIINMQQQDAYQLYSIFIQAYETVYNEGNSVSLNRSSLIEQSSSQEQEVKNINIRKESGSSLGDYIFNNPRPYRQQTKNNLLGYTKSSITCTLCKQQRNIKIQPFYDLSCDISQSKIKTLTEAINYHQQKQVIQGYICTYCSVQKYMQQLSELNKTISKQDKKLSQICVKIQQFLQNLDVDELQLSEINEKLWKYCQNFQKQYCQINHPEKDLVFKQVAGTSRTIIKQSIISKFPNVLVIHLKQLSINPITGQPILLRKRVDFPMELKIKTNSGVKEYELVSLISHVGNQEQGHYFTFRKEGHGIGARWFLISDTRTVECQEKGIKGSIPYMLFYQVK